MARMSAEQAWSLCQQFGINPDIDYHAMSTNMQFAVVEAADERRYVKPKNANGSRGRYFAAYLRRTIDKGV